MNSQTLFPSISIIVLAYNGEAYLSDCLAALLVQGYPYFELIVVDNASQDRSVDLIKKEFSQVTLIENDVNLGFGGGNNVGIEAAMGEIIVLLNQDTVVAQTWLAEIAQAMSSDEKIGIVGCKIFNGDGCTLQHAGGYLLPNGLSGHYGRDEIDNGQFDYLRDVCYVTGAAMAIRREVIEWCGALDPGYFPAYYEETDLCLSARKAGYRVVYAPKAVVLHYELVSSDGMGEKFLYRYHKNRIRFILKIYTWDEFWRLFAPFEYEWWRHHKPVGHNKSIFKAYLYNLCAFPKTLLKRRTYKSHGNYTIKKFISYFENGVLKHPEIQLQRLTNATTPQPITDTVSYNDDNMTETNREENKLSSKTRKKILLLGGCPLPFENEHKTYSVGLRTWQFASALLAEGHEVCLVASRLLYRYPKGTPDVVKTIQDNLTYYSIENELFAGSDFVQKIYDQFEPDCIIAANNFPSYIASQLKRSCPLWADLYGHLMTEAQSAAYAFENDWYIDHFLNQEMAVLQQADKFSVVSKPQRYAALGELGLSGRLNQYTAEYTFVHCIHTGVIAEPYTATKSVIRQTLVDEDDFVVLWSGGYNTWADVETLFYGLEKAMAQNDRIRFVSTGGQIDGHDEQTYPHFVELISQSRYKDRYILCGWVEKESVPNYYLESDVGINIDRNTLEGVLGCRTRIFDWSRAALPVLTTSVAEIAQTLATAEACFVFNTGDSDHLAERLLELVEMRDLLPEIGQKARAYIFNHFSYEVTTRPLCQWVNNLEHAPDRGKRQLLANTWSEMEKPEGSLDKQTTQNHLVNQEEQIHRLYEQVQDLDQALREIRATRWWRLASWYWRLSAKVKR